MAAKTERENRKGTVIVVNHQEIEIEIESSTCRTSKRSLMNLVLGYLLILEGELEQQQRQMSISADHPDFGLDS